MLLTIFKIDMKGKNDIIIKRNDEVLFQKEKMSIMEEIEIPKEKCDKLRIEITYLSPLINSHKLRRRFFFKLLFYHLIPHKKDSSIYGYQSRHCCKKIIVVDRLLNKDCTLDYVPYQDSRFTYDSDGSYVRYEEKVEYPYSYISYLAKVLNIFIIILILFGLFYINYMWIRQL